MTAKPADFQALLRLLRDLDMSLYPNDGRTCMAIIAGQVEANRLAIEAHHRLLIALEEFVSAKIDLIEYKSAAKDGSASDEPPEGKA
jgi:hypothetical protein